MDILKTIELLPKYTQVLYNDCVVQLSNDNSLSDDLRKNLILKMISNIKNQLELIEKELN